MATLENGTSNAKSARQGISSEFQSKDLPSRRLLGKGLSGIGYETAWKGARYARKDFVGVQRDIFVQEAAALVGLEDHKNIVKTYGWTVDKRSCSLVLEYMDEDLLSLLQKRMDSKRDVVGKPSSAFTSTQPVDLPEAVDMMLQIATGVKYLHEQGLAHGDLKTKNILVSHRKDGEQSSSVLKLSDFGVVETKRKSRYIVSRRVRKLDVVRWKSPESLKTLGGRRGSWNCDEDQTSSESESESAPSSVPEVSSGCAGMKSSDVYSFGLICSQILTGDSPYPYLDWKELLDKVLSGFRPVLPDSLHPLLRELLMSCWGDPAERPSFSTVRLKLIRVQGLLTTAMGKRPHEAAVPSLASPAHEATVVPLMAVSTSFGNRLSLKALGGPSIITSEWSTSVTSMRSNTTGVPSAASSAPTPPTTAAESPVVDESNELTQPEDLVQSVEEALREELTATFDPSMNSFLNRSSNQSVNASSYLNNDPTVGQGSNLSGRSFLEKFVENEVVGTEHCYRSEIGVQTGPRYTGTVELCTGTPSSASLLHAFKTWQRTSILPPSQQKREKSKNQWLLRRCLEGLHLISSCKSDILSTMGTEPFPHSTGNPSSSRSSMTKLVVDKAPKFHMLSERRRRVRLKENFEALRKLMPVTSKSDKVSILDDAITYLKEMQGQIYGLQVSKSQVDRQYEDLKLSHEALQQRVQQLEASKSEVEHQYEDSKLSPHWEYANPLQEASKSEVEHQYEDSKLSHYYEHRNPLQEASKSEVEHQYEDSKLCHHYVPRDPLQEAKMYRRKLGVAKMNQGDARV